MSRLGKREMTLALAIALCWCASALADHPLHSSRATVEFNAETCSWEVSLCVFPDDLAEALSKRAGRTIRLESEDDLDVLLSEYVGEHFQLRLGDARIATMQWLGHELATQQAWLYFEFPVENESPDAVQVKHTILMEQFEDQINIAYVRLGGRQHCMTFRTDTPSWNDWSIGRASATH
jgi:hypothetical protein